MDSVYKPVLGTTCTCMKKLNYFPKYSASRELRYMYQWPIKYSLISIENISELLLGTTCKSCRNGKFANLPSKYRILT